jgi:hypothetical protein
MRRGLQALTFDFIDCALPCVKVEAIRAYLRRPERSTHVPLLRKVLVGRHGKVQPGMRCHPMKRSTPAVGSIQRHTASPLSRILNGSSEDGPLSDVQMATVSFIEYGVELPAISELTAIVETTIANCAVELAKDNHMPTRFDLIAAFDRRIMAVVLDPSRPGSSNPLARVRWQRAALPAS